MPHVPRLLRGFRRERPVVPGKWDTITHLPSRNEPDADTTPSTPVWAQPQPGSRERPAWAAPDADEIFVRRQLLIVWAEFGLGGT
ncbi:hypothetical protein OG730_41900 (plasmid) [Streptomyces sp. NBC_01298]|uniref:hypothetical protein n=1 Tax=Streptomyces sp. NBC_01298 TaxID=2903817 RepID=UPI002E0ECAC4|nr:hypothetical protein OG730_41900 [Streptomyces sp. NBC_01298]